MRLRRAWAIREITCKQCEGTGMDTEEGILSDEDCPYCNGKGYISDEVDKSTGELLQIIEEERC